MSSDDAIRAWKDPHADGHFDDHPAGTIELGPAWSVDPTSNVTKTFETTDGGWDLFFPVSADADTDADTTADVLGDPGDRADGRDGRDAGPGGPGSARDGGRA